MKKNNSYGNVAQINDDERYKILIDEKNTWLLISLLLKSSDEVSNYNLKNFGKDDYYIDNVFYNNI